MAACSYERISADDETVPYAMETIHVVAQLHLDAAVPEPLNADVDFRVVDFLEFRFEH